MQPINLHEVVVAGFSLRWYSAANNGIAQAKARDYWFLGDAHGEKLPPKAALSSGDIMQNDPIFADLPAQDVAIYRRMGFRFGARGTHTSRTIMLEELGDLFFACSPTATRSEYASAIIDGNCLHKKTAAARRISSQRLRELYGLDPSLPLFRLLRYFWSCMEQGRPLLALLAAMARDPLLRMAAPVIFPMEPGKELMRQQISDILQPSTEGRLSERTRNTVVRNIASSWTQSGHLQGRVHKIRRRVEPAPTVAAYALLLGYFLGIRGPGLLETLWTKTMDTSRAELQNLVQDAKRLGFLDLSQAGGVAEISFMRLLTNEERRMIDGKN